jgi:hypothetical protein
MGLVYQGFVEKAPKQAQPGWENFKPIDGSYYFEKIHKGD